MSKEIVFFEKLNGERILAEVEESGKTFYRLKNPMVIHPVGESKIGFGPCLYTDPQKMHCKLYVHSISIESSVSDEIQHAYREYVKRLTSSIISLDTSIQKVQLNG